MLDENTHSDENPTTDELGSDESDVARCSSGESGAVQLAAKDLPKDRYVYFLQCGADGPIKIGSAGDVRRRVAMLQIGCPFKLHLLFWFRCDEGCEFDANFVERWIHKHAEPARIRGEWFDGPPIARAAKRIAELIEERHPDRIFFPEDDEPDVYDNIPGTFVWRETRRKA